MRTDKRAPIFEIPSCFYFSLSHYPRDPLRPLVNVPSREHRDA